MAEYMKNAIQSAIILQLNLKADGLARFHNNDAKSPLSPFLSPVPQECMKSCERVRHLAIFLLASKVACFRKEFDFFRDNVRKSEIL